MNRVFQPLRQLQLLQQRMCSGQRHPLHITIATQTRQHCTRTTCHRNVKRRHVSRNRFSIYIPNIHPMLLIHSIARFLWHRLITSLVRCAPSLRYCTILSHRNIEPPHYAEEASSQEQEDICPHPSRPTYPIKLGMKRSLAIQTPTNCVPRHSSGPHPSIPVSSPSKRRPTRSTPTPRNCAVHSPSLKPCHDHPKLKFNTP